MFQTGAVPLVKRLQSMYASVRRNTIEAPFICLSNKSMQITLIYAQQRRHGPERTIFLNDASSYLAKTTQTRVWVYGLFACMLS